MVRVPLLLVALAAASTCVAQDVKPSGPLANKMGFDQRYGEQVPKNAQFRDENHGYVSFGDALRGRPVVLMPMFFGCDGVCRLELDGLLKMLEKNKTKQLGRDFDVVFLSIHPKETPDLAREKEKLALTAYGIPSGSEAVHSWVGDTEQIHRITNRVGFRYTYDEASGRINHPAGIVFLDPRGVVTGYMFGKDFPTVVFNANVDAAAKSEKGVKPEIILLGCIMVDPITGKRTLMINRVVIGLGILTVVVLGSWIGYMSLKYRTAPLPPKGPNQGGNAVSV